MAQLHVTRVRREFREIVTSEEVRRGGRREGGRREGRRKGGGGWDERHERGWHCKEGR